MKLSSLFSARRLAPAAALGLAVFVLNLVPAIGAPPDLFTDAGTPEDAQPTGVVIRQHTVRVNTDALKSAMNPGALISFNLFADTSYTGVVETVETRGDTGLTLVGHVQGKDVSSFVLVQNKDVVVMNLRPGSGLTQLRYVGGGLHAVRQVDENLFPPCANTAAQAVQPAPRAAADARPQAATAQDSGSLIDVMVVYTPAARVAAGGTNAIQALITLAFTESNTAYQQSLITPRIRLVYQQEVNYTESGDFGTDLQRLTDPADGYMDEVLPLRNTYGADLVSLWSNDSDLCGIGWLMTQLDPSFESNGYCVVYYGCATGYYSFAHEMGHNMGCQHDRENAGGQGLYSYSYGWRFTGNDSVQYRTIMAYAPGARIQRFSNPNVSYMGVPTGNPVGDPLEAYNALTINNSASTVANFRQSVVSTNQPPSIDVQPASQAASLGATVTFSAQVSGSAPLVYQWRTNNLPIPGATQDHYTITNVQFSDANNYSLYVTNAFGTATSSNATLTVTDLGNGVDAPTLPWTTGGDAPWFVESTTTHDGVDALQAGHITDSQSSWVETTVVGPGALTFWWKVSSEAGYDWLTLYTNGVPVPNAAISGEVDWQFVTLPVGSGPTTVHWEYAKDFIDTDPVGQDTAWLDQVSFSTLDDAVDNQGLTFTVSGDAIWYPQSTTTHDGVDAAASGQIISASPTQSSRMQATVNGPTTLSFWWKVSSETNFDFLRFFTNGVQVFAISGEQDWQQQTVNLAPGSQSIAWQYDKDDSVDVGQDQGWVDQVVLGGVSAPSRIISNSFSPGLAPQFSLQFTGVIGGSYTIQSSTNLLNWVTLTNIISTNQIMPFVETGLTNYNRRFYRIISP
jgi:hypothetical protein